MQSYYSRLEDVAVEAAVEAGDLCLSKEPWVADLLSTLEVPDEIESRASIRSVSCIIDNRILT